MTAPADGPTERDKTDAGTWEHVYAWLTRAQGRLVRYALVLLVVALALVGLLSHWFVLCRTVTSAKDGLTTTCSAPDLTSAGVLAAVVLVLLLLWPDLSEFSVFGVTIRRLVLDVKERVTDTRQTAHRIEERATASSATLDRLQAVVIAETNGIGRQLASIESSVGILREQAPVPRAQEGRAPAGGRWYPDDLDTLRLISSRVVGSAQIEARLEEAGEGLDRRNFGPLNDALGIEAFSATRLGVLLALYRTRMDRAARGNSVYEERDVLELEAMQVIEKLLFALINGQRIDRASLQTAIALLWALQDRDDSSPERA